MTTGAARGRESVLGRESVFQLFHPDKQVSRDLKQEQKSIEALYADRTRDCLLSPELGNLAIVVFLSKTRTLSTELTGRVQDDHCTS